MALLLLSCACLPAQQAGIEGIAVHSVTGQPLSGVHVRLFSGVFDGVRKNYGAMSDSSGRFSIAGMEPGAYVLMPEKAGFVHMVTRAGGVPSNSITLKVGQRLTDFKLVMTPKAVISGRVLDEYGEPVANVMVQAEPVAKDGPAAMSSFGRIMSTNDRGEFRISGGPGKYRIKATPYNMREETEIRTDGSSTAGYGPTYYPSTASKDQGGVVDAGAGGDTAGIDIQLVHPPRGLTISGVVTGMPEAGRGATVMLQSGDSPDRMNGMQGRGTAADGKFVWKNLQPQFYRVFAQYRGGKIELQSQAVDLTPASGDMSNLELVLGPGQELAGKLEIAGNPSAEKRLIRLEPVGMYLSGSRTAPVDKDGGFRFSNLLPGKFRVHVDPMPDGAYFKALQVDGADVAGRMLDLTRGGHATSLKIAVGRNGGQISGSVLANDGAPLANGAAFVYLQQKPADTGEDNMSRVTPEGKYSFKAVPPGKYRVYVLDAFHAGIADGSESFQKRFAAAEEIEIKEGGRIAKDLKLAAKE